MCCEWLPVFIWSAHSWFSDCQWTCPIHGVRFASYCPIFISWAPGLDCGKGRFGTVPSPRYKWDLFGIMLPTDSGSTWIRWESRELRAGVNLTYMYPANTKHLYNSCTMLDQRQRRWADAVYVIQIFCVCWEHNAIIHRKWTYWYISHLDIF